MYRGKTHNLQQKLAKQLLATTVAQYQQEFEEINRIEDLTDKLEGLNAFLYELNGKSFWGESQVMVSFNTLIDNVTLAVAETRTEIERILSASDEREDPLQFRFDM